MTATSSPRRDPTPETNRPWYRRRGVIIAAIVAVVLVLAVIGGLWWYLRDDAPDAVDLETAAESIETTVAPDATGTPDATVAPATDSTAAGSDAGAAGGIAGSWAVDTSIGEFSFEDSTGTFVGFRIDEELSGIGATTAVGRTPNVSGTIAFDGTTLVTADIEADMTAIVTDESRRDDRVQSALGTSEFPTATFTLTEPIDLGEALTAGAPVSVDATGDLTIHGVTTPVTIPLDAQVVGDTIVVVGSLDIELSTYDVEAPSAPIVVSVSDEATIELQLFFSKA